MCVASPELARPDVSLTRWLWTSSPVCVSDIGRALRWYDAVLGSDPYRATPTEAVYDLAEHRFIVVDERPERAGHSRVTVFVDDLDEGVEAIAGRGVEPVSRETYDNGVRKVSYRDPDGNAIEFGGAPVHGGS